MHTYIIQNDPCETCNSNYCLRGEGGGGQDVIKMGLLTGVYIVI